MKVEFDKNNQLKTCYIARLLELLMPKINKELINFLYKKNLEELEDMFKKHSKEMHELYLLMSKQDE